MQGIRESFESIYPTAKKLGVSRSELLALLVKLQSEVRDIQLARESK